MQTNLKALSVALLLSTAIPAFGMGYFRNLTNATRAAFVNRPALTVRNQIATRMARSFVPRTQITMPRYQAAFPGVTPILTAPAVSKGSWYSWFKKPFVAVAAFLGFGVASQPALAEAEDKEVEDLAQQCLKRALKDKLIKTAIKNSEDAQWQTALPMVDTYVFDKCYIDKDEGRQCAQVRERTLSLLEAERMKILQAVSDKDREAALAQAELRAKRLQQLTELEKSEIQTTTAEIWKTLAAGFRDSQGNRASISTIPDSELEKAVEVAAVNKCLEPNSNVCAEAKKRAIQAIVDYRKALAHSKCQTDKCKSRVTIELA